MTVQEKKRKKNLFFFAFTEGAQKGLLSELWDKEPNEDSGGRKSKQNCTFTGGKPITKPQLKSERNNKHNPGRTLIQG